jgi:hypothetical protein
MVFLSSVTPRLTHTHTRTLTHTVSQSTHCETADNFDDEDDDTRERKGRPCARPRHCVRHSILYSRGSSSMSQ